MHKAIENFGREMFSEDYEHFDVSIRLEGIIKMLNAGATIKDFEEALEIFEDRDLAYKYIYPDIDFGE